MLLLALYLACLLPTEALSQNCPPEPGVKTVPLNNTREIWQDLDYCALISRAHFDKLENAQLHALAESKPLAKAPSNLPVRSFAQLSDVPTPTKNWRVLVTSGYDDFAQQA